mmetsp:Transcript_43675/g.95085  ORF Transcript_43675/g.95085 Transcript_43675/m.95085 type:complete len:217 (-) Transcript_43675:63-713(-)
MKEEADTCQKVFFQRQSRHVQEHRRQCRWKRIEQEKCNVVATTMLPASDIQPQEKTPQDLHCNEGSQSYRRAAVPNHAKYIVRESLEHLVHAGRHTQARVSIIRQPPGLFRQKPFEVALVIITRVSIFSDCYCSCPCCCWGLTGILAPLRFRGANRLPPSSLVWDHRGRWDTNKPLLKLQELLHPWDNRHFDLTDLLPAGDRQPSKACEQAHSDGV